jgi:hypothetical protein
MHFSETYRHLLASLFESCGASFSGKYREPVWPHALRILAKQKTAMTNPIFLPMFQS